MATKRERLERRLEKRQEWAEGREAKASASFDRAHQLAQMIPLGQPILVGHHSERGHRAHIAKIEAAGFGGVAHSKMASKHSQAASGIEDQLARSIFDDDPDAIDQLKVRIEALEAKREGYKAFNLAQKAKGEKILPSYVLSNLGAEIRRNKQRLERLEKQQAPDYEERPRFLYSVRYAGTCRKCGKAIEKGAQALYFKLAQEIACFPECGDA